MTTITDNKVTAILDEQRSLMAVDTLCAFYWLLTKQPDDCDIDWQNFDITTFNEVVTNTYAHFLPSNDAGHLLDAVVTKIDDSAISDTSIIEYVAQAVKTSAAQLIEKAESMSKDIDLADRLAMSCQQLLQPHLQVADLAVELSPAKGEVGDFAYISSINMYNFDLVYTDKATTTFTVKYVNDTDYITTQSAKLKKADSSPTSEFAVRLIERSFETYAVAHCIWLRKQPIAPGSGKAAHLLAMLIEAV